MKKTIWSKDIEDKIYKFVKDCYGCKSCMRNCVMLNDFCSSPKKLFEDFLEKGEINSIIPYSCNMCKQCTLVCPKKLKIDEIFMDMRKELVIENKGKSPIKGHKAVDIHQKLSYTNIFKGQFRKTRVAFMPGCSLSSYNPQIVEKTKDFLSQHIKDIGIILNCCGKPTEAIGKQEKFKEKYKILETDIKNVDEIITACSSCYSILLKHSKNIKVRSLWEVIPKIGIPEELKNVGKESEILFGIQDACTTRDSFNIHEGIRWILKELGYKFYEPIHTKENTMCCGMGGMVFPANKNIAQKVIKRRAMEFKSDYVVTYCASCRQAMELGDKKSLHILDLIFGKSFNCDIDFKQKQLTIIKSWVNRYKTKKACENYK
ncbi:(Fe-S)-binding protein [Clostridium oceanicum]|uniref:(Fe-S)-binding protein n=1 Tax=Clostridium oceanicum TaxID=1543 RepID=A0ABN1J818_9CLOT